MEKTIQQIADEITALLGVKPTTFKYRWNYKKNGKDRELIFKDQYRFCLVENYARGKIILDSNFSNSRVIIPLL